MLFIYTIIQICHIRSNSLIAQQIWLVDFSPQIVSGARSSWPGVEIYSVILFLCPLHRPIEFPFLCAVVAFVPLFRLPPLPRQSLYYQLTVESCRVVPNFLQSDRIGYSFAALLLLFVVLLGRGPTMLFRLVRLPFRHYFVAVQTLIVISYPE